MRHSVISKVFAGAAARVAAGIAARVTAKFAMKAAAMATGLLVLASCIAEDTEYCPPVPNTLLRVITDYEMESLDPAYVATATRGAAEMPWYEDQINSVSVYVFDEADRFVAAWTGGKYTMGEEYIVPLVLEEDKQYSFVAWTNLDDPTQRRYHPSHAENELHGGITRGDMGVNMNVTEPQSIIRADIPHRHHGRLDNAPVYSTLRRNEHTIVINPHTYKLNFIVRGLPEARLEDTYEVTVDDSNTTHRFDASFRQLPTSRPYKQLRELGAPEGGLTRAASEIRSSMILLQIGDDTGTSFGLTRTETVGNAEVKTDFFIEDSDLLEAIADSYPNTDLDWLLANVYEYDIILTVVGLDVSVEVEAWNYKDNTTEL